jgi:hypothetical protein
MGEMSPVEALQILRAAGELALRDADGHEVSLTVAEVVADGLEGTAPRLAVAADMVLTTRLVSPDGDPWVLRFVVEQARFATQETADVRLRLDLCQPDPHRRLAPRLRTGGKAWLTAISCQEVVDGDRVDGSIQDISESGVAFGSSRVLRKGDRLTFHGRFFSDEVVAELRVISARPSAVADRTVYGCQFIEIDESSHAIIGRLLRGERAPSADLSLIHSLVEEQREAPRKRRFFR